MINLYYSEAYWGHSATMNGPHKVVDNLIKSLDQENIDYAINEEKYEHNFLVQYDATAHEKHSKIEQDTTIIGPQVWMFDGYGQFLIQNQNYYKKIIAPSEWVKNKFITKFNLPEDKLAVWPVGIEEFNNIREPNYDCLIYFKRRDQSELDTVKKFLVSNGLSYRMVEYGTYGEDGFKQLVNSAKFCFLINGTESQGIAVQEIMSMGVPIIAWDIKEWLDQGEAYRVPATSIPYWDERCGEVFFNIDDLEVTFSKFYATLDQYDPKAFIKDNLSFKCSVKTLLDILL
jgi:glycosyltransferase involved in cell wall biosynthesis